MVVVVGARVEELSKQSRQAQCSLKDVESVASRGERKKKEEEEKTSTSRVGSSSSPPHLFLCCYNDRSSSACLYYSSEREWLAAAGPAGMGPPKTEL